jgi:hypothetical protein
MWTTPGNAFREEPAVLFKYLKYVPAGGGHKPSAGVVGSAILTNLQGLGRCASQYAPTSLVRFLPDHEMRKHSWASRPE